jgi:hypothetical protein
VKIARTKSPSSDEFCRLTRVKIDALELLGKHHKLYVEHHQHEWGAGLADRLAAALARVDGPRVKMQQGVTPEERAKHETLHRP